MTTPLSSLAEQLRPDNLIVSQTVENIAKDWLDKRAAQRSQLTHFSGQNVCLQGKAEHIVKWMILLDGIVNRLLLVPHDACDALRQRFIEKGEANCFITDSQVLANQWPIQNTLIDTAGTQLPVLASDGPSISHNIATEWVLATSGTTDTPKLVAHTLQSLTRTVATKTKHASLNWGLLYDPTRFAGVQLILQALINGQRLLLPPESTELATRIQWLVEHQCSALSATPTLWRKVLMTGMASQLPLQQITLGGEIADAPILNALSTAFPAAHITHVYASTEAGVGFAVHDGQPGFPADWLDSNSPIATKLKISKNNTLCIELPARVQKYLNHDADIYTQDNWVDTGDLVEWIERRIIFKGRLNGSINVGGNKVIPEEVESLLLAHPNVRDVIVQGKANSIMGTLVEACIIPTPERQADKTLISDIKAYCRQHLASYKVPAFIKIVDALATSTSGKRMRAKL